MMGFFSDWLNDWAASAPRPTSTTTFNPQGPGTATGEPNPWDAGAGGVFLGYTSNGSGGTMNGRWMTPDQAELYWYDMPQSERDRFWQQAERIAGRTLEAGQVQSLWNSAVTESARFGLSGQFVSPWDVALRQADLADPNNLGGSRTGGPTSSSSSMTSTNTWDETSTDNASTINLTNPGTAKRLLNSVMQVALGRDANKKEVNAFIKALRSEERANPETRTTESSSSGTATVNTESSRTTNENSDGTVSSSVGTETSDRSTDSTSDSNTVTDGGFDAQQFAMEYAQSRPDYAEYQMATTYLDAFRNLIRGTGGN